MSSLSLLNSRDLGVFPISKSTSLAIEALANLTPDRDPVLPMGITRIDSLMVNIRTLIRNVESAFKNDEIKSLSADDIKDVVIQEMDQVVAAMKEIAPSTMSVGFYFCNYKSLGKFRSANLVVPTTPGQIARHDKVTRVIGALMENFKKGGRIIKEYDLYPLAADYGNDRMAFLTHLPMDLIEHRRFNECLLLESNTGRLKDSSEFYTKLHKKIEGVKMPFNMLTLQVFGDGKIFKPMISAITEEVLEVANKGKWTPMTTPDKMRFWIGRMKLTGYIPTLMPLIKD